MVVTCLLAPNLALFFVCPPRAYPSKRNLQLSRVAVEAEMTCVATWPIDKVRRFAPRPIFL